MPRTPEHPERVTLGSAIKEHAQAKGRQYAETIVDFAKLGKEIGTTLIGGALLVGLTRRMVFLKEDERTQAEIDAERIAQQREAYQAYDRGQKDASLKEDQKKLGPAGREALG